MSCTMSWKCSHDYAILSKHSEGDRSVILVHTHQRKFQDTKGVIRNCKSKMDRQCNVQTKNSQKDKQWSTQHYRENYRSSNTSTSKERE